MGDLGLIPGLGRSPGGGHGNPLQDSCLENSHGQRILVGYSPWRHKELATTERLSAWTLNGFAFTASGIAIVVQSLSCAWLFETLWTAALQASLSFIISSSLLKLRSFELMKPSSHLKLSPSSPAFFNLSQHHGLFQWVHIRWPKYWSFSFSISPSNECSGLVFCRIDKFDLLSVQGTFKSLLQHHSSKASILWHAAWFIIQLSHPSIRTGKP